MKRTLWGGVAASVLLLVACGDDGSDDEAKAGDPEQGASPDTSEPPAETTTTQPPAEPPPLAQLEGLRLTATQVVDTEMLTAIAWREGDPDPYVADQHGQIYHVVDGRAEPVLDLTPKVLDYEPGAEYGMLGMTFDPVDGRLIVGFNSTEVDTLILSYAMRDDGRPDPGSEREILRVEQPGVGHNSGQLAFDGDGNLFIAMGDGGGSRGADAQDMTKLLGGLLRITPNRDGPGYTVPDDNPFVGQEGVAPEIWAKGMRNPWRFSIDEATGDMWIGDVGEDDWESVYKIPPGTQGVNLGWPAYEGSNPITFNTEVQAPADPMMPVHEYPHSVGPAVIGGYVYRGDDIPRLEGAYVFMDMTGPFWAMGADGVARLDLQVGGTQTTFGQDPDGELYILTLGNGLFKLGPG